MTPFKGFTLSNVADMLLQKKWNSNFYAELYGKSGYAQ
jgi:hypothetical protein